MKILPLVLVFGAMPLLAQEPAAPSGSNAPGGASTPPASATRSAKVRAEKAAPPPRPVRAESTPVPVRRAEAVATPAPKAEEKRPGFFKRIFRFGGIEKKNADSAATPEPTASPKPTPTPARKPRRSAPKPTPSETPEAAASPTPSQSVILPPVETNSSGHRDSVVPAIHEDKPASTPAPKADSPVSEEGRSADAQPPVSKPARKPKKNARPPAPEPQETDSADTEPAAVSAVEFDRARYLKVKKEAAADPEIAELGKKLNATPPGGQHQAAAREYSKALFAKMRSLDPSQQAWLERLEAATLRRIDAGKPFVAE